MKTETCKLYSRDFEYFRQISSKSIHIISSYTVSKLGPFLRHIVDEYGNSLIKAKKSREIQIERVTQDTITTSANKVQKIVISCKMDLFGLVRVGMIL